MAVSTIFAMLGATIYYWITSGFPRLALLEMYFYKVTLLNGVMWQLVHSGKLKEYFIKTFAKKEEL